MPKSPRVSLLGLAGSALTLLLALYAAGRWVGRIEGRLDRVEEKIAENRYWLKYHGLERPTESPSRGD